MNATTASASGRRSSDGDSPTQRSSWPAPVPAAALTRKAMTSAAVGVEHRDAGRHQQRQANQRRMVPMRNATRARTMG